MKKSMEQNIRKKIRERLLTLPDFAVDFLYLLENSKEVQTRFEYAKDIALFLEFLLTSEKVKKPTIKNVATEDLDKLQERDFIDFFDYLSSYTKTYISSKGKTIVQEFTNEAIGKSRKLATLRKLFSYLFGKKLISKDITPTIEIKVPAKVKISKRLSPEEVQSFFATIVDDLQIENERQLKFHEKVKRRDYIISLLFAYTGIRVSELVQLDINEVRIQKKTFIVTRKGGDEQEIRMPERIISDIEDFIEERKQLVGINKEDQQALFISLHKKRIDPKSIRAMIDKYRIRSGIQTKITPHVFRRTFGTNHYNTYEDMYLTAQVLGHSSAETTRKFYADPSEERVTRSMKEFDYNFKSGDLNDNKNDKLTKLATRFGISVEELKRELG